MAKLQVEAIINGSVIDHIPAGQGINILKHFKMLDTQKSGAKITVGFNLPSGALGSKDLIKIENRQLSQLQANQLAVLAPGATVNIIEDSKVVKKYRPELPDHIDNVYRCPNSNCITNHEPSGTTFYVKNRSSGIKLKCKYCEKSYDKEIMSQFLQ
ncbi:MAG: aspartate carbamoyltransferase regulatory subunit [Succinivibrionaceae bacterium]